MVRSTVKNELLVPAFRNLDWTETALEGAKKAEMSYIGWITSQNTIEDSAMFPLPGARPELPTPPSLVDSNLTIISLTWRLVLVRHVGRRCAVESHST